MQNFDFWRLHIPGVCILSDHHVIGSTRESQSIHSDSAQGILCKTRAEIIIQTRLREKNH